MSVEEKVARIRELRAEIARLTQEAEAEYFTPEKLERFAQRYRSMKYEDALILVTPSHPNYDDEFCKCAQYCRIHRLYGFGVPEPPKHNPPVPRDDKFGLAPTVDFDTRMSEANRLRDEAIAKEAQQPQPGNRGEIYVDERMAKRLDNVAKQTADFDQRAAEAKAIADQLASETKPESRVISEPAGPSLAEQRERIAKETKEHEVRQAEAARLAAEARKS
jgi:hypothetical protein